MSIIQIPFKELNKLKQGGKGGKTIKDLDALLLSSKYNDELDDDQKKYLQHLGGLTKKVIKECLYNKKIGVNIDEQSFINGIVLLQSYIDNISYKYMISRMRRVLGDDTGYNFFLVRLMTILDHYAEHYRIVYHKQTGSRLPHRIDNELSRSANVETGKTEELSSAGIHKKIRYANGYLKKARSSYDSRDYKTANAMAMIALDKYTEIGRLNLPDTLRPVIEEEKAQAHFIEGIAGYYYLVDNDAEMSREQMEAARLHLIYASEVFRKAIDNNKIVYLQDYMAATEITGRINYYLNNDMEAAHRYIELCETYIEFYDFLNPEAIDFIDDIRKEAEKCLDYRLKHIKRFPEVNTEDFPILEGYFRRLVLVMGRLKDKGKRIDIRNFNRIEKKIKELKGFNPK